MTDLSEKIVIVGGGAIGLSIAYHLAKLGFSHVQLLERHQLTSGTSWHAAGIVGPLRASMNLTHLAKYGLELFERLEQETGQATGYQQTGGIWLAQTKDRMTELARIKAMGNRSGLQTSLISAREIAERIPMLETDDLKGGLWVEQDGQINPVDLCMAYAKAARTQGVEILENTHVQRIETSKAGAEAVILRDGSRLACDRLVLAAGAWSRDLAATAGVLLPLAVCEHMYVVTDVVENLSQPCPIIRDLEAGIYIKGDSGKLVLGAFEANPKPWLPDSSDAPFLMFEEDWDHAQPMLEAGIHRAPLIADLGITHFMNGPESFTPDTRQLMGESTQCRNLFVATGFNSIGIMSSAGVGKVMAGWVRDGVAPVDLWEVDVARVDPLQSGADFLSQRLSESVYNQFDIHWPYKQFRTGRNQRQSAWHTMLEAQGAVFGAPTGWERPLFYQKGGGLEYSYGAQHWWSVAQQEALHCQHKVSLFELSPFGKIDVQGEDAHRFLQRICCGEAPVTAGRVLYTLMLNPRGGIEAEVTVSCLAPGHYRMVGGAATRFKDLYWLQSHLSSKERVTITDVTETYAVLGVMGPRSRELMSTLCEADFSDDGFPFSSCRKISIDGVKVLATRLSFVGELGWELMIPVDQAETVLKRVQQSGRAFELGFAGHFALDSCRLEKGYLHWGHDMGSEDTPFETGCAFAVKLRKPETFIGKEALLQQQANGWTKQLKLCEVSSDDMLILHDEPVYQDAEIVGHCTSGGKGFRTGKTLCFVMFYDRHAVHDNLEIECAGIRVPLQRLSKPPYQVSMQ